MAVLFHPRFLRLVSVFILGFLIGGALVTTSIGTAVDNLNIENKELSQRLEAASEELDEVKKNLADQRRQVVTGVEVYISLSGDNGSHFSEESYKLSLEKEIKQILKPVVGQEVRQLNYALLPQLVEGRIITVEETPFLLKVRTVVLTDKLIFYISAALYKNSA